MARYDLKYPIEVSGSLLESVAIRRMKFRDARLISGLKTEEDRVAKLIALQCELSDAQVDELDIVDVDGLGKKLGEMRSS